MLHACQTYRALFVLLLCWGCKSASVEQVATPEVPPVPFQNISRDIAYVGDETCASCHEELYASYQSHGMAQSYYPLTAHRAIEPPLSQPLYHAASNLYYRVWKEDSIYYQEEFRLDSTGRKIHSLVRPMQEVVGSGTAARTYITSRNHWYYEMPLTFYTQQGKWDFSPGYREKNGRFSRKIPQRCIACHNSYPEAVPFVEGKYLRMPDGIGCERCHGPGALHVEARLSDPEPSDSIDTTILNPAHLPLNLRLDVCQQCHLHGTVSLLREGREAFDFRPGEPLSAHIALFVEANSAENGIGVISHADRMKKSACFIGSLTSKRPMDCTTCHNPHEGFRQQGDAYFNATCLSCHATEGLQERVAEAVRAVHTPAGNCIQCHMPKVEAEDAPHASFTDHWIRVVDSLDTFVAPLSSHSDQSLVLTPYFEQDKGSPQGELYLGMAYLVVGQQQKDQEAIEKGISLLKYVLARDSMHGEAQYLLGFALLRQKRFKEAVAYLERAVRMDPNVPERLNALAQVYEVLGRSPIVIGRLYRRALSIQPAASRIRVNYGRFLETQGRLDEALEQYKQAVDEEPWLDIAHYNLGTAYLRAQVYDQAEHHLKEAIHLNPDYAMAMSNLGILYALQQRPDEALYWFKRAVEIAPEDPVALNNLASYYLNQGEPAQAIPLLERAIALNKHYVDALVNLALAYFQEESYDKAGAVAREVLKIDPENMKARQILAAL